jgi:spermidine synthase
MELARAQSERGELVLRRRQHGFLELRANGVFVMDTAETTSERALATEALARHDDPAVVLVGGLGLGFTLAEVLADLRVRRVVVAEIEPALVGWLRDGTVPHGPALLADPRVEVVVGDVAETLAAAASRHDAVAIVVGSRGLGRIKARLLGSTSRRLLHDTRLPVLVVRTPEEEEDER